MFFSYFYGKFCAWAASNTGLAATGFNRMVTNKACSIKL